MKLSKVLLFALVFALAMGTMAHAGSQVQLNQAALVKAAIQNTTNTNVSAAVKLTGYDDVGTIIGHLCQETYLGANSTQSLSFNWQAPSYATGIYWSPKVVVGGSCETQDVSYDRDSDSDSDSDGDSH